MVDNRLSPGNPVSAKRHDAKIIHVNESFSISRIAREVVNAVPRNHKIAFLWLMGHGGEAHAHRNNMSMVQHRGVGYVQLGTGLHYGSVGELIPIRRLMQPSGRCFVYACSAASSAARHAPLTTRPGDGRGLMHMLAGHVGVPVIAPEDTQKFTQYYVSEWFGLSVHKADFAIGKWEGPVNIHTADGEIKRIKTR